MIFIVVMDRLVVYIKSFISGGVRPSLCAPRFKIAAVLSQRLLALIFIVLNERGRGRCSLYQDLLYPASFDVNMIVTIICTYLRSDSKSQPRFGAIFLSL